MATRNEERYVPTNAVKISGFFAKNKAFDFADNLTVAKEYDARNIFGVGGKETVNGEKRAHNPPATIKCSLSDFRGNETVFVQHNLDISVFPLLEEVIKKNVGETAMNGELASYIENLYCEVLNTKMTSSTTLSAIAGEKKDGLAPCEAFSTGGQVMPISAGLFTDWEYSSTKVNSYRKGADGFVPVSDMTIRRQQYIRSRDGNGWESKKLPWHIEIVEFEAQMKTEANGTTPYMHGTERNKKFASIDTDDNTLFEAVWLVNQFIDTYKIMMGVPNLFNAYIEENSRKKIWNAGHSEKQQVRVDEEYPLEKMLRFVSGRLQKLRMRAEAQKANDARIAQ